MSEASGPRVLHTVPNPRVVHPWLGSDKQIEFPQGLFLPLASPGNLENFAEKYVINKIYVKWDKLLEDTMRRYPHGTHDMTVVSPGGIPGGLPSDAASINMWSFALAQVIEWMHVEGLWKHELRKAQSHLGAHLADYVISELWRRADRQWWKKDRPIVPENEYTVVPNGAYVAVLQKTRDFLASEGVPVERWESDIAGRNRKNTADACGDLFETLCSVLLVLDMPESIIHLVEYASWVNDQYQGEDADLHLRNARLWDPTTAKGAGGGQLSEACAEPEPGAEPA
ncbi:MAG: hypothetical protein GY700_07570, partial [Propionibacteriaceae bacterium]|nr:hypothetical protein [Propionibacteriaceae bacterium]